MFARGKKIMNCGLIASSVNHEDNIYSYGILSNYKCKHQFSLGQKDSVAVIFNGLKYC